LLTAVEQAAVSTEMAVKIANRKTRRFIGLNTISE
jgi:hypothetical protein